jgi:hypothetical protein
MGMWRDWNPESSWFKCKMVKPLQKAVWQFLRKIKHRITMQQLYFWFYSKELKAGPGRDTC